MSIKNIFLVLLLLTCSSFIAAQAPIPLKYGESMNANLPSPSSTAVFTSPIANPGDVIFVKVSSNALKLNIELFDPENQLVDSIHGTFNHHLQIIYPIQAGVVSGKYKLIVSNAGIWTGDFCVTMVRMNDMPDADFLNCNSSLDRNRVCNSDIKSFRYVVAQGAISRITIGVDPYIPEAWVCAPDGTILKYGLSSFNNQLVLDQIPAPVTGCYHVFVTDAASFWTSEVSVTHTLLSGDCMAPSVQVSPANGNVCFGSPFSLLASSPIPGATFVWSGPNGFTSNLAEIAFPEAVDSLSGVYAVSVTAPGVCQTILTKTIIVRPLPTAVASVTPVSGSVCHGQSFSLNVTTNASAPVTYKWVGPNYSSSNKSPTIYNATPSYTGFYKIAVTDGNECVGLDSVWFTVHALPSVSITEPATDGVCKGSTLQLFAQTDASPATYLWAGPNGFSSMLSDPEILNTGTAAMGTYYVTVTNVFGCTNTTSNFVTVWNLPNTTITPLSAAICFSDSLKLTAGGGSQYFWSTGQTTKEIYVKPIQSTSYSVTVTDTHGCAGSASASVTVNPLPTISVSAPSDLEICFGENPILLCAVSSSPGSLNWIWTKNNAFFSNNQCISLTSSGQSGVFQASVTEIATGCSNVAAPLTVNIYPNPVVDVFAVNPPPYNAGDDIMLCANSSTGNLMYEWNGPNGFSGSTLCVQINNADPLLNTGIYFITVKDEHGCVGNDQFTIEILTDGVTDPLEEWSLSISPNPSSGFVYLQTKATFSQQLELDLFDTNGRHLRGYRMASSELTLDLNDLPAGNYYLRIKEDNKLGTIRLAVFR